MPLNDRKFNNLETEIIYIRAEVFKTCLEDFLTELDEHAYLMDYDMAYYLDELEGNDQSIITFEMETEDE